MHSLYILQRMTPTLQTKRLILQPASLDDCAALQPLFADWEVVKYMTTAIPWPNPDDGVYAYTRDRSIPEMDAGTCHSWTLIERTSLQPMGRVTLRPGTLGKEVETEHRGYWIGQKFQRKGYMGEALAITADFAFDTLGMPLITSSVAEPNEGSNKLQLASGAHVLKRSIDDCIGGRFPDILWGLTPEAWAISPLRMAHS